MTGTVKDSAVATSASKEKRGLLDLPPEIWSKIGKCAVENAPYLTLENVMNTVLNKESGAHQPAITRACRILRNELLPYFYNTRVNMNNRHREPNGPTYDGAPCVWNFPGQHISRWLERIGPGNAKAVRGLSVVEEGSLTAEKVKDHWGYEVELGAGTPCGSDYPCWTH